MIIKKRLAIIISKIIFLLNTKWYLVSIINNDILKYSKKDKVKDLLIFNLEFFKYQSLSKYKARELLKEEY